MKSVYFILILIGVFTSSMKTAYAQRVYADQQQYAATLLASVTNPTNSVDADTTNHSTLNVTLSLIRAVTATQNLQFTGTVKPQPTAPLMIRFASQGSVLGFFDGVTAQRTFGGINQTVGEPYTSDNLLDLLGLVGTEVPSDATVPIPGTNAPSDGVQLTISSGLLGFGFTVDLY